MINNNHNNTQEENEKAALLMRPPRQQQATEEGPEIASLHKSPSSPLPPPPPPPPPTTTNRPLPQAEINSSPTVSSSRVPSRSNSLASFSEVSDNLPTDVSTEEQLKLLPPECISGDKDRPLRHVDEWDEVSHHALQPMFYSVIYILMVELLERFSFYGINYTQTSFLTGDYNEEWNADFDAVEASTYVSISVAVAYTTPFIGAILADSILGDYYAMLVGAIVFYIPGLLLIAFTTIPGLLGEEFNRKALSFGLLFLWPMGTGIVKSIVNVFGAKQHHPLLQSSLIESYYVKFYMCINIGALIGGFAVPILAQYNVIYAYFLPCIMLSLGISIFLLGTPKYVRSKPKGKLFSKKSLVESESINTKYYLGVIFRISFLIVPFNVAYAQMATTFIVQGTVMQKFGFIDAACMNNADAFAVLFFGSLIGSHFYPWLQKRGIRIATAHKFAIGSTFGVLAIGWALFVDFLIKREFRISGGRINILWQALSYILIGAGEIFAVSSAYEAAFTASPPSMKALSSAVNLFCVGGVPNVLSILLYNAFKMWFRNSRGTMNITKLEDYASAHVSHYFSVLFVISCGGVAINLLPQVKAYIEGIEEKTSEMLKSPKSPRTPTIRKELRDAPDENKPLLRVKRHQAYLKYGSGPQLYKNPSMRAGPSLSEKHKDKERPLKRKMIARLYNSNSQSEVPVLISGGTPVMMKNLIKGPGSADKRQSNHKRTFST